MRTRANKRYSTEKILAFIKGYQQTYPGVSPTFGVIQEFLDISSKSVVRHHLLKLQEENKIKLIYTQGNTKPRIRGIIVTKQVNGQ